ncbi:MAG TPA: DUF3857 domain-containing protein [Candidatus Angelobacter sp.]|nr:DUF3857 domain-containing protein [Candidatus Angelobacter sp.]
MTADSAHQGDAIILYREETADDMTRHRYVYMRVKVLTEKGKSYADVHIPYDGSFVGISDLRGRSIAPDGAITPFTGKAFNTTIVKAHGVKYLAKTFTLPNVQVGSIIEWKYTAFWDDFLIAPRWVVQEDLFQKKAKFTFVPMIKPGHEVIDSRGEAKDGVFHMLIGFPEKTEIKTTPTDHYELELHDIPAFEEEDFAPPADMMKMRVNFYYGSDRMTKPVEFWKNEGKYWNKEVDQFAGHSAAVANTARQATTPSDTAEQKARKIYAYAQKITNLDYVSSASLVEEITGRPGKAKRTVDDVLHKNEGYRDEIARLFWGMARAVNLTTYIMRVADRDQYFFQSTVPNPDQLTSEIVVVVIDGKEVFLDPGTPLCPYGLLSWQHNSTQGMRQMPDGGTALAVTPPANYKDAVSKRVGHILLNDDGSAKGTVAIAWSGEEALAHRLNALKTDEAGRKKELEDELKTVLPPGTSVQMDKATGWDEPDAQLKANFTIDIPSYASNAGKRLLVPTNMFQTNTHQPFTHGERKQPIYFNYPYYEMDDTQITFPAAYHMESLGQDVPPVKTDYSIYKVKHSVAGNTVTISRDFAMAGIGFQQKDYPELRKFYNDVNSHDSEQLVLSSAAQ